MGWLTTRSQWAAPLSTEPRRTLVSYAAPCWTTPLQMSLTALHWTQRYPAEPRGTLTEPRRTYHSPLLVSIPYNGCMLFVVWHFKQKLTKKCNVLADTDEDEEEEEAEPREEAEDTSQGSTQTSGSYEKEVPEEPEVLVGSFTAKRFVLFFSFFFTVDQDPLVYSI